MVESYPADFHEISNILDKYELLMHVKIKLVIYQFIELNLLDEVRWKFVSFSASYYNQNNPFFFCFFNRKVKLV